MQENQSEEQPAEESTQIEMETDVEGEDHAIVAMIDNRFVFKIKHYNITRQPFTLGLIADIQVSASGKKV